MPQPDNRDLHVDSLLSNISVGYLNEPSAYIADLVFPVVLTDKQSDKYAIYDRGDWLRDDAQKRSPATESAGGGFKISTPGTFFCDEWAFHKDIPNEDEENADEVFDVDDDATQFVIEKLRIRRERLWAEKYFATSIWDKDLEGKTTGVGSDEFLCWDESSSTPVDDIEGAKTIVKAATGLMPNTLIVSERVHQALKNHSTLVDRFKYTQTGVVTADMLARVFELDRYLVAKAVYASSKEGDADVLSYILSQADALLVYSAPRPARRRPSGGYTFRWRKMIAGERFQSIIRKFWMDKEKATRIEGSVYEDLKLVAPACGVFFHNSIALGEDIS